MLTGVLATVTAEFQGDNYVLLGEKLRGPDIGKLVLPGGKEDWHIFHPDADPASVISFEHPDLAVVREVNEETGLVLDSLDLLRNKATSRLGALTIGFETEHGFDSNEYDYFVTMYRTVLGSCAMLPELTACDELLPAWHKQVEIPAQRLQPDVAVWLPHFLKLNGHPSTMNGNVTYQRYTSETPYQLADFALRIYNAESNTLTTLAKDHPDSIHENYIKVYDDTAERADRLAEGERWLSYITDGRW